MDQETADAIRAEFASCLTRTLTRLQLDDTHKPFHLAMMPDEAVFWSRFERSFSTSFGQSVVEKISRLVALAGGASAALNQKVPAVSLTTVQFDDIENIVRNSRGGVVGYLPDWEAEVASATAAGAYGVPDVRRVIVDLWWKKGDTENFMSIKTVKPNIDQTAEAKRDLLKLAAEDSTRAVYFGLYYNPYGEAASQYAWAPPRRLFDFAAGAPVIIGRDFWDTIGGAGTYEEVIRLAGEAGEQTRPVMLEMMRRNGY